MRKIFRVKFNNVSQPVDVDSESALDAGKSAYEFLQTKGYRSSIWITNIELIAEPIVQSTPQFEVGKQKVKSVE